MGEQTMCHDHQRQHYRTVQAQSKQCAFARDRAETMYKHMSKCPRVATVWEGAKLSPSSVSANLRSQAHHRRSNVPDILQHKIPYSGCNFQGHGCVCVCVCVCVVRVDGRGGGKHRRTMSQTPQELVAGHAGLASY